MGLFATVPIVGTVMLITLLFLSAPLILIFLIMDGKLDLETIKDGIIYGAIVGMVSNISFVAIYSIVTVIIYLLTQYSSNLLLTTMIMNSPVWLLFVVIIFMGVLTATTNAFSGFLTYYFINMIRDNYEKKHCIRNDDTQYKG